MSTKTHCDLGKTTADIAAETVAEYLARTNPRMPHETPDCIESIAVLHALIGEAQDALYGWVVAARGMGQSWAEIGAALGMSKQAAQQRFGKSRV